jgi:hypothetical protein
MGGDWIPPKGSVAVTNIDELLKTGNELVVVVYMKDCNGTGYY